MCIIIIAILTLTAAVKLFLNTEKAFSIIKSLKITTKDSKLGVNWVDSHVVYKLWYSYDNMLAKVVISPWGFQNDWLFF